LIKCRKKPIAIAARAILRAGSGHKYWSGFGPAASEQIEMAASGFNKLLFEPEADTPIKTLELPIGGSVSPVDALALLIEIMSITGSMEKDGKQIDSYPDDTTGTETLAVIDNSVKIMNRITGNSPGSLGLHPAVYFYNERAKFSRFMFLGMVALIQEKVRENNSGFFKKFTIARKRLEEFLISNKNLLGLVIQNLSRTQRVPKMRNLFEYLVNSLQDSETVQLEQAIAHIGLQGRILDVNTPQVAAHISDDTKSIVFLRTAISTALCCPICGGILDPKKSVSYDHITPVREKGHGGPENVQLAHPYCNTGYKESQAEKSS